MDRRSFLASAAGVGAAALAGCASASGEVPPPRVSQEQLDQGGWKRVADETRTVFEQDFGPATLTATARSRQYVDAELTATIQEQTLGAVQVPLMVFNATRVGFSPDLDSVPIAKGQIKDRVAANAREQFEASLEERGLVDIKMTEKGSLAVDTGESADNYHYTAAFPLDDLAFDVRGQQVTIEGGKLDVQGWLAAWNHDGATFVAASACPGQDFERSIDRDLSEAINVSVDIDLGLTPDAYRKECLALMRSVH